MLLPKKVASFTLMRKLEAEDVAESYVAILDEPAGKQVVARRVAPTLARDATKLAALRGRVKDLMAVRHPTLVPVLDLVEADGDVWVLEDWIDAVDFRSVLAHCSRLGATIPHNVYLNLATQVCNGLEALHSRSAVHSAEDHVLHLSMSPETILVCPDGRVVLAGFGLTRSPTAVGANVTGSLAGQMEYLSPEQTHQDQRLSPASDIFSLGTILYELLTMRPMFRAESNLQTIHKVRRAEVTTQLLEVKEILPGLDKVLFRALSLNPRHRYQRAFVLREDLRGLMAGFSFADIQSVAEGFLGPMFEGSDDGGRPRPSQRNNTAQVLGGSAPDPWSPSEASGFDTEIRPQTFDGLPTDDQETDLGRVPQGDTGWIGHQPIGGPVGSRARSPLQDIDTGRADRHDLAQFDDEEEGDTQLNRVPDPEFVSTSLPFEVAGRQAAKNDDTLALELDTQTRPRPAQGGGDWDIAADDRPSSEWGGRTTWENRGGEPQATPWIEDGASSGLDRDLSLETAGHTGEHPSTAEHLSTAEHTGERFRTTQGHTGELDTGDFHGVQLDTSDLDRIPAGVDDLDASDFETAGHDVPMVDVDSTAAGHFLASELLDDPSTDHSSTSWMEAPMSAGGGEATVSGLPDGDAPTFALADRVPPPASAGSFEPTVARAEPEAPAYSEIPAYPEYEEPGNVGYAPPQDPFPGHGPPGTPHQESYEAPGRIPAPADLRRSSDAHRDPYDFDDEGGRSWAPLAIGGVLAMMGLSGLLCVGVIGGGSAYGLWVSEGTQTASRSVLEDPPEGLEASTAAVAGAEALVEAPAPAAEVKPAPTPKRAPAPVVSPTPKPSETWQAIAKEAPPPRPRPTPSPRPVAPSPVAPSPVAAAAPMPSPRPVPVSPRPAPVMPMAMPDPAPAPLPPPAAPKPPPVPVQPVVLTEMEAMSAAAFEGRLSSNDSQRLAGVATDDVEFTRARTLLYLDAKARGERPTMQGHLALLMTLPENRYNPILLVEEAQDAVERRDWDTALDRSSRAERNWARLPSDLIYTRKALIYEIEAVSHTGLFYESEGEDLDELAKAIRGWEKFRRHVSTKDRQDLLGRAEKNLGELQEIQRRVE